jgi:hypothetical protein
VALHAKVRFVPEAEVPYICWLRLSFGTELLRIVKRTEFMLPLGMMRHMQGHWRKMFLPLIADRSGT